MKSALSIVCLCLCLSLAKAASLPASCADSGKPGVQLINVPHSGYAPFNVFCDMKTMNGNWTVIQRRIDGKEDFYRPWFNYKYGFGNASAEYWIGLARLHLMASYEAQELLILLEDFNNKTVYAHYKQFEIADESESYKLKNLGTMSGTTIDSLSLGKNFTTYDRDTSSYWARNHKTGWWANEDNSSNLNGMYLKGKYSGIYPYGIFWSGFTFTPWVSLKSVSMMIRPKPAWPLSSDK